MSKALAPKEENIRLAQLEDCEHKIGNCLRRGLEATVGIGNALAKILELELYEERGCKSFSEYLTEYQQIDPRTASRFIEVATSVKLIKDSGLELPANETQVAELARLEPEDQPMIWNRIRMLAEKEEQPITANLVRSVVDWRLKELAAVQAAQAASTPAKRPKSSLDEPDLDLGSSLSGSSPEPSNGALEVPERISLTEAGEEALERIRRLCGEPIAEAIEHLRLQISERELIEWAQEEDPSKLTHYVVDLRWTVSRALGFVNQVITERTQVGRLLTLARANGGHFETEAEGSRIQVDVL